MFTKGLTVSTLELKDAAEGEPDLGLFAGLASVYNVVDRVNDVVLPGAFTQSIAEQGGRVKFLYQHNQANPIGIVELTDSEAGLQVMGRLVRSPDVPEAAKAWALMKAGVLDSLSIGYDTVRSSFKDGVRQLQELKLWEVSLVTIPANPYCSVLGMKALRVLGAVDGVKTNADGAVDALFESIEALSTEYATEVKRGAVLSARNRTLLKAAFDAIREFLEVADAADGINRPDPPADETADQKSHVSEADAALLQQLTLDVKALAGRLKG